MVRRCDRQRLRCESLESRRLLAFDALVITEFMSDNETVLIDDDGDFSDWIELYNPTSTPIALAGWSLTDDPDEPDKWQFSGGSLDPGEYLLIFASGKNRRLVDGTWHTNFRLDADGEYLGLVDPSGEVVHAYEPTPLPSDQSYGLSIAQSPLIVIDDTASWRVPTLADSDLVATWAAPDFDDSDWNISEGTLGYDLRPGIPNVGFETGDLSNWSSSGRADVVNSAIGIRPPQRESQAHLTADASSTTRFALETFLSLPRSTLNEVGNVSVTRGSAIKRNVTVEAGSEIQFDWNFLTDEPSVNGAQDYAFLSISPGNRLFKLAGVAEATTPSNSPLDRETGYQTFSYVFPESGEYTIGIGVVNEANQFLNSALLVDRLLVDGVGGIEDTFNGVIQTSIESSLAGIDSSLWWRKSFQIDDVEAIRSLELQTQFDDALVVYLNGQRVHQQNVVGDPVWNSHATSDLDDIEALSTRQIRLDTVPLREGENWLAVQTLKAGADDGNLLMSAQLTQLGDVSETPLFLTEPTPGSANISEAFRMASDVQFSRAHGFYDQPFELELSTATPDATIRYTLDGSSPISDTALVYEGPIRVDRTHTIRAAAEHPELEPSRPVTQSYLFIEDVISQDRNSALARGFPTTWGEFPADYVMDQRVIGQNGVDIFDGVYADTVREDLLAVPSLSIVMDMDDLFGSQGIYSHPFERGVEWERPTSFELIYPDGREGLQIDAGIRIQGGISRFIASKLSLRLLFKEEYGAAKLEFPIFGPDAGSTFDSLSLRSSSGEHLVGIHYIRDEYVRRSELATGNLSSRGNFMHLYINGLYWGVYNPVERIDGQFAANYLGGEKEDYDVLNAGDLGNEGVSVVTGSLDAWTRLDEMASDVSRARSQADKRAAFLKLQGLNPDGSNNPDWESYLNVDNYIDYLITQVHARNADWPIRNYYMLRRRGPDSTGFHFLTWDSEFTLDRGSRDSILTVGREGPGVIFNSLLSSEDFRVAFADRVQLHFSPGGTYYVNPASRPWDPTLPEDNVPAARYAALAEEVYPVLGPESARWGDERGRSGPLFVRDDIWALTVASNLSQFFPNRSRDFLADLRRNDLYRDAPELTPAGGLVQSDQSIEMRSTQGPIYFTTDGSDPRNPDGTIADSAVLYEQAITVAQRTTIHARSLQGESWSAVNVTTFYTDALPASADSLRISELNYNPHDPLVPLGELDLDNDEFEFIEIINVDDHAVDLTNVRLARVDDEGVEFTFGTQLLDVGQRVVVPRNRAAIVSRYGNNLPLARGTGDDAGQWVYQGRLGNDGEVITLLTADGQQIQRLAYDDEGLWPERADGGASSLEVVQLTGDVEDPSSFQSSVDVGGSPGRESGLVRTSIVVNEILASPLGNASDQIELYNSLDEPVDVSGWLLTDSSDELLGSPIPGGTIIAPRAYLALDQSQFNFGLSATNGDQVVLVSVDIDGRPSQFVDSVSFGATQSGVSLGRWPDGMGPLYPMAELTFGSANLRPRSGDVVITEVHYQPRDPDGEGPLTEADFEFIELHNRSGEVVDLSGWRVAGDIQFEFGPETFLAAAETLIVLPFDPDLNPVLVSAFGLTFPLDPATRLFGPREGTLNDTQGTVQIERPSDTAVDDPPAWILVDRVEYSTGGLWPSDVLANGQSLNRVTADSFGSSPTSWLARSASPGSVDFSVGMPGDVTLDGKIDLADVDLLCQSVIGGESSERMDLNADGHVDVDDVHHLVVEVLGSRPGDANLDGVFNSSDLVIVFAAAEYEDRVQGNSTWADGDWNCDGEFNSSDLVAALVHGTYSTVGRSNERSIQAPSTELRTDVVDRIWQLDGELNRRSEYQPLNNRGLSEGNGQLTHDHHQARRKILAPFSDERIYSTS